MTLFTPCCIHIVGRESKTHIFDFYIFHERQKLGVSYIATSQTGLHLATSKCTDIGVLNFL